MIKYLTPIVIMFLFSSGIANASVVRTNDQVVTACKTHLKENVEGFKGAKLSKIRNSRDYHKVTFAVSRDSGREKTICLVDKQDGGIKLNY